MSKKQKTSTIPAGAGHHNASENEVDNAKRTTLKTIGATSATIATTAATGVIATNTLTGNAVSDTADAGAVNTDAQHITINIQKNKTDHDDWVLIENMTEQPLMARSFEPRYVQYDNTILDLNALLSRQQKGKNQLELWPNHAWTHSTRDATRAPHALRPVNAQVVAMNRDTRSVQIGAQVNSSGQVTLSPNS